MRRFTAVVLVSVPLAGAMVPTAGAVEPAQPAAVVIPEDAQPSVDAFRKAYPGVGEEEALRRLNAEDGRVALIEHLVQEHAATFGGSWYEGAADVQHLLATTLAAASAYTSLASGRGIKVSVHPVEYSLAQLRAEAQRLSDGRHPLLGAEAVGQAGFDMHANRVLVGLTPATLARVKLPKMIRAVPRLKATANAPDVCYSQNNCGRPMRSGIEIVGPGSCSLGFTVTGTTPAHLKYLLTAGHCGAIDSRWRHGEQPIGPMRWRRDSGDVDAAAVRIDSAYWRDSTWGWIYNTGAPNSPVKVDAAITSESSMQEGQIVCLAGQHSRPGQQCGRIEDVNDWGPIARNMTRVGFDAPTGACRIHATSAGRVVLDRASRLVPGTGLERGEWDMDSTVTIGRIGIVGVGRAGGALGVALRAAGHEIAAVSARSPRAQERVAQLLPGVPVLSAQDAAASSDLLLLGVPDDAIETVAGELAPQLRPRQFVVHLSGAHGLAVLAAARERGAVPVALHPPMTFTGTAVDVERLAGVTFTATAPDAAREMVERLAKDLGTGVQWIGEEQRAAYHAGLVHGANHLVTLIAQASDVLKSAGIADPPATLGPLVTAVLDNALQSGHDALTGPIVRGDVATVRAHLAVLTGDARASYVVLARSTVDRAAADGRLDGDTAARLRQALDTEGQR